MVCDFCDSDKNVQVYATDYAPISLAYCEDCCKVNNLRTKASALIKWICFEEKSFNEKENLLGNKPMVFYKNKYVCLENFVKEIDYDDFEHTLKNHPLKTEGLKKIKKQLAKKRLNDMNTFKQKVETQISEALKASKTELLIVLRDIKSQLVNEEKNNKNQELDEAQTLKVLEKMSKARKQSIDLFTQGNRPELAEKEKYELSVIDSYLPKKLSTDEVKSIIEEIIKTNNYATKRETGLVIKKFNESYAGMSDGGTISKICGEYLK